MDIQRKIELVNRPPTEEIITQAELRKLFETNSKPKHYIGFEPSGLGHLGTGYLCTSKIKDFQEAGVKCSVYLATWHAWINEKYGGDLDTIRKVANYFKHLYLSLGVDKSTKFFYGDEVVKTDGFWETTVRIAKKATVTRVKRALPIMGRGTDAKDIPSAWVMYPAMQAADIFMLEADIAHSGMDQRKVHMLAREAAQKLKWRIPVAVHHHLLSSLIKLKTTQTFDENKKINREIQEKMSKSIPDSCVYVHDSPKEIEKKVGNAFCPAKVVDDNPVLEICKYIIFREFKSFEIDRAAKFGGPVSFETYAELESSYKSGKIHPLDLKAAAASHLIKVLKPSREYFENNREAKNLFNFVKSLKTTR